MMKAIALLFLLSNRLMAQDYQNWHPPMSHADMQAWLNNCTEFWVVFAIGIFAFTFAANKMSGR
jgi:hypothetical protein